MDDDDDITASYYRSAYEFTQSAIERNRKVGTSPTGLSPAEQLRRLRAQVRRDLGGTDAARIIGEAIDDAVADAEAGREPRW